MQNLKVLFWNIENLGDDTDNPYRTRQSRLSFIANLVRSYQPDILCIQELKSSAITNSYLPSLQEHLNALPAPLNNWYYDWIKGSLATGASHPAAYPYNQNTDLDWDSAHHEGYAVFWNQNIAKFIVNRAPPIQPPGALAPVANTQSETCRMAGQITSGAPPAVVPIWGIGVPAGGIQVPAGASPYVIPAGTVPPGGTATTAAAPTAAGTVIPANTLIGPAGITLAATVVGVAPIVVPGGFTLTDNLTLPAAGAVVVPQNALSLVMFGRDSADPTDASHRPARFTGDISAATVDFAPGGGAAPWNWIEFTSGAGASATRTGCRRPAALTIEVNNPALSAAANRLVPIIVYHAPSTAPASSAGMQRAAYARQMYQAYDWGAGAWIDCSNALLGGDFNVVMDEVAYAYNAFLNAFGGAGGFGGGAGCTMAVANPAVGGSRANNPLNKSIVALTSGIGGPPVYSAVLSDYRAAAIDNIFYRGLGGGVVGAGTLLLDLLVASSAGGSMVGAPIMNCLNTPAMVDATTALLAHRTITLTNINSVSSTLLEMQRGSFGSLPAFDARDTPARRAGEFVKLFVSDHLPVGITFTM